MKYHDVNGTWGTSQHEGPNSCQVLLRLPTPYAWKRMEQHAQPRGPHPVRGPQSPMWWEGQSGPRRISTMAHASWHLRAASVSLLLAATRTPWVLILVVTDSYFLTLVPGKADGLSNVISYATFVATFSEQGINSLDMVPSCKYDKNKILSNKNNQQSTSFHNIKLQK